MLAFRTLLLSLLLFLEVCVAAADPGSTAEPLMRSKVQKDLAQWEFAVSKVRAAFDKVRPVRVSGDGRYECEDADSHGALEVHKGTLSDADRHMAFTAAIDAFNGISFADPVYGSGTDDAGMYDLRLSSGSRSIHLVMDEVVPQQMKFEASLIRGFQVLNKISRKHGRSRHFPEREGPPSGPQSTRVASHPMIPTIVAADWSRVSFTIVSKDQSNQITVSNPSDDPDDRFRRRYRGPKRADMDITITAADQTGRAMPRAVALSNDERETVFHDVRGILNQFELRSLTDEENTGDVRCVIGIAGWLRELDVEFPLNDTLPQDWRARISRLAELGHRKDEKFPGVIEFPRASKPKASEGENLPRGR